MAEQMRPADPSQAPDPSFNYERSHPGRESGQGSLDTPIGGSTPADQPDMGKQAVKHGQESRQLNADQDVNQRAAQVPTSGGSAPQRSPGGGGSSLPVQNADHSMKEEEPLGWDQVPTDIHDPTQQRHPRTGGNGGTP